MENSKRAKCTDCANCPEKVTSIVPRHLFLPRQSLRDVGTLLRLDPERILALGRLLDTKESVQPGGPSFNQRVVSELRLNSDAAASVVLVGQFLLTVTEGVNQPEEVLDDVREFLNQYAVGDDKELVAAFDTKRTVLRTLLAPKPNRSKALKVRYLSNVFPTVDAVRSVCELRPVFEHTHDTEDIAGYVPSILLEIKQSTTDGG